MMSKGCGINIYDSYHSGDFLTIHFTDFDLDQSPYPSHILSNSELDDLIKFLLELRVRIEIFEKEAKEQAALGATEITVKRNGAINDKISM